MVDHVRNNESDARMKWKIKYGEVIGRARGREDVNNCSPSLFTALIFTTKNVVREVIRSKKLKILTL